MNGRGGGSQPEKSVLCHQERTHGCLVPSLLQLIYATVKASVPNLGPLIWVENECHGSQTQASKQHNEMSVAKEL